MTLRKKTLLIVGATFVGLIIFLYFYSQVFLLGSFADLEKRNMEQDVERGLNALFDKISALNTMVCDYAWWDDTCKFVESGNQEFVMSNFTDMGFVKNKLNFVVIVDNSGNILHQKGYDLTNNTNIQVPRSLLNYINKEGLLARLSDPENSVSGILMVEEMPMIIAARPILDSSGKGPVRGAMIMGRYLDESTLRRLSIETNLNIEIKRLNEIDLTPDFLEVRPDLFLSDLPLVRVINNDKIGGYVMLRDIYSAPVLIMRISADREIYHKGCSSIDFFIIAFLVIGLIVGAVVMWFLERVVLSPLARLNNGVFEIGSSGDLTRRVLVKGRDELASLSRAINRMLEDLQRFQESETRYVNLVNQLQTAHQQLMEIIDFLPDATFVIDNEKQVIAWNNAMEEMTGIRKDEVIGKSDYIYAFPFYGEKRPCLIDLVGIENSSYRGQYEYLHCKGNTLTAEVYVPALGNGRGAYLMVTASPLYDSSGNKVGAIESIRDVTERKKAEELQLYMSLHDSLTNLHNRTYFEQMIDELEKAKRNPVGLILCDVDGLKIANDTMGHDIGDKLLLTAAIVIKKPLTTQEIVARIGGDEFAILLPGKDKDYIEELVSKIRLAVGEYNSINPKLPLSISIGYAVGGEDCNLRDVFKEADNNMYREKLHHSQSNRSAIVQALMKALEARDFITEGHADRLQNLVAKIGTVIGLSEARISDLRLLGQFHDIGKVGIPDRILFKQGPLTPEEYTEMKRHSEIGYRIAQSIPELVPIADWVLKHHERWDGKGYPLGLKGEGIPLECRILALADAYDAMVSDRPYRNAMPHEKAMAELIRCAGTQFDPYLVEKFVEATGFQGELIDNVS